jgi:Meckel syndrome type 1 protein
MLPWAIGALAIAALAIYFLLRRRRRDEDIHEEAYREEPVHHQPVHHEPAGATEEAAAAPEPIHREPPIQSAPEPVAEHSTIPAATVTTAVPAAAGSSMLTAPVIGGIAAAVRPAAEPEMPAPAPEVEQVAPATAAAPEARPRIDLRMRPVRAGVDGEGARVEFELTVDNSGSLPAEDVRVSTWMLAAGASDAEQALIAPAGHADTPSVTIPAGEARTMEASVGLPASEVAGDSVLPVVVAEVSHRLADGTTAHATARFAVGVPDGEELAHFATHNPSGLHEGVVARELGEIERA